LDPKDEENAITRVDDLQYARYNGHLASKLSNDQDLKKIS
jgi:hypothetical protein